MEKHQPLVVQRPIAIHLCSRSFGGSGQINYMDFSSENIASLYSLSHI